VDGEDFVAGDVSYDWLLPGLLERGDRFLITGGEGSGKSVLSRQIGVATAAGVHPFTGDRVEPRRVLLVDLENGTRHLRRALRALWDHTILIGRPISRGMLTVESRPSGVDLTQPEDRAWLRRLCEHVHPELLVIGPLYRMHAADMNAEEPARLLTRTIDEIRAAVGCAVVLETHAPHGQSGMVRNLRPVGSSLFRRWPEFGYGLRQSDDDGHVMSLVAWRGARDERDFPDRLARGGPQEWPWAPHRSYTMPAGWGEPA
jgi:replicative DNA helicase